MDPVKKSERIKKALREGFQDGTSKMAQRKCYGYDTAPDGDLKVNPVEAQVVIDIFESYLSGSSLGKIAADLEKRGIASPSGRPRWNREAINKLLSNEKYTGRVLLQKTVSTGASQIKNDGFLQRYLIPDHHEAIISDDLFQAVQNEKQCRNPETENVFTPNMSL